MRWPAWIPYPTAWINATILALLLGLILLAMRLAFDIGKAFVVSAVRPVDAFTAIVFFSALVLLIPIPVIAVVHHLIFLIVEQTTRRPKKKRRLFPGLMSWAEALRSWMVTNVAMLLTVMFFMIWLYFFDPDLDLLKDEYEWKDVTAPLGMTWFIISACLYQIEYLANQRMLAEAQALTQVKPKQP